MDLKFDVIKSQVSIEQVLSMLEINHLTARGDRLRGACPFCKAARNFSVTPAEGLWHCFSCKERSGGNIFHLVARHYDVDLREAGAKIVQHFKLNGSHKGDDNAPPQQEAVADGRKSSTFDAAGYQKKLDAGHEALDGLGVSPETIRKLGGGYASSGPLAGRLALPLYSNGELAHFFGLSLTGDEPMLKFVAKTPVPHYFNAQNVKEGVLILCQDVPTFLHAVEHGEDNIICTLRPITVDTLSCLQALMRDKGVTELELF